MNEKDKSLSDYRRKISRGSKWKPQYMYLESNVKQAVKEFRDREWDLFIKYMNDKIDYLELSKLRMELIDEIFGDKLTGNENRGEK